MDLKHHLRFLAAAAAVLALVLNAGPARAGALDEVSETIATDDVAAGLAAHSRGDNKGAIQRYTQAIDSGNLSRTNLAVAHNNRGNAQEDQGDLQAAMADFDMAIRLDAGFGEAYFNRAFVNYRLGRYDAALLDYDRAIQMIPLNASAYFNRSFAWAAKKQYNKAVADVEKAISLSPYNSKYHDQLVDWKAAAGGKK